MHNWLGQEINVGDYVYRGARDGNSSTFKIGRVVDERNDKVRVNWLYDDWGVTKPRPLNDSFGWLDPRSLFVMHPEQGLDIVERLENEAN